MVNDIKRKIYSNRIFLGIVVVNEIYNALLDSIKAFRIVQGISQFVFLDIYADSCAILILQFSSFVQ